MLTKFWMILALVAGGAALSGCGPAIGAGAVIAADEIAEEEDGDDGLF